MANIDGTWGFVYVGEVGIGMGGIVVKDGKFHGTDSLIKYAGTIAEDPETGELSIHMEMDVPAGVVLVGGAGPLEFPSRRTVDLKMPPLFGEGAPLDLPVFPGKTVIMFKRIQDEYAKFADGFEIRLKP